MKQLAIFSLLMMLCFTFCKKQSSGVIMTYQATQCADPWMADANFQSDKSGAIKRFLISKNIDVISLSIALNCDGAAVCLACNCKGCDKITVEVPEDDVADMEVLFFKRQ